VRPSFTTLGTPEYDIETVCERAAEWGFEGVDFRGLGEDLDVTQAPAFGERLEETRALFDERDLAVSGLSTSISICGTEDREAALSEAERTIALCTDLGAEYARVFGHGDPDATVEERAAVGAEMMDDILALEGADELTWAVESHDRWTSGEDLAVLLDAIDAENVGALWDVGHTPRVGGEAPAETLEHIGDDVVYAHVKDAVHDPAHPEAMDDGWRYVLPGEGEVPVGEALDLLAERGFDGWVVFEHEKRWHPELPDPEEAYPAFVEWFERWR
jgi:sugar phosphate isomerase/epimerase